jgi:hypothetical protein
MEEQILALRFGLEHPSLNSKPVTTIKQICDRLMVKKCFVEKVINKYLKTLIRLRDPELSLQSQIDERVKEEQVMT